MVTGCALVDVEAELLQYHGWSYNDWQLALGEHREIENSVIWNEVHDEISSDLCPSTYNQDRGIIQSIMASPPSLRKLIPDFDISLKIEPKISDRWGS
jgi:hypothetical protein